MTTNLIRDGQTRPGYVLPLEGIHQGVEFAYRPMLATEVEETDHQVDKSTPTRGVQILVLQIVSHLQSWSETTDDGKAPEPITADTVSRLPYQLLTAVYRVVAGLRPSDVRPQMSAADADDYLDNLKEAAERRAPIGAIEAEVAEKN